MHIDYIENMNGLINKKNQKHLNLGDPEGDQGWWEGHRKSQDTPDLLEEKGGDEI
jgi:hypothetical protein